MKRNLILSLVIILSIFAGSSLACSRLEFAVPTCALYTRADAVFLGKAIKVKQFSDEDEDNAGMREVQFKVLQNFKGAENPTLTITTNDWRAACGLRIGKGQMWLIYADYDKEDKIFRSNEGSKYKPEEDREKVDFLKTASEGNSEVSIFGSLVSYFDQVFYKFEPAEVILEGNGNKQVIKTDSNGLFKFSPLIAGNYKVQLKFPFKAALEQFSPITKYSVAEGNPTIFDYEVELKKSECNYTQFGVFKYTPKQPQQ